MNLPDHGGQVPFAPRNYFVPAPREIGTPRSAWSTLAADVQPMTPEQRFLSFLKWGLGGFVIGLALIVIFAPGPISVPILFGLIALLIPLIKNRFKHTVTWVGNDGIARYVCKRDPSRLVKRELLRFDQAITLRTTSTRHYTNGAYMHTSFSHVYADDRGRELMKVAGSYQGKKGPPPSTDFFQFALAAEYAWSEALLARVEQEFRVKGSVDFPLTGEDFVRLGKGWIELSVRGKTDRREAKDIARVILEQGHFTVEMKDAKKGFFTSSGVFRFDYGAVANARVFLMALPKLTGLKLS